MSSAGIIRDGHETSASTGKVLLVLSCHDIVDNKNTNSKQNKFCPQVLFIYYIGLCIYFYYLTIHGHQSVFSLNVRPTPVLLVQRQH